MSAPTWAVIDPLLRQIREGAEISSIPFERIPGGIRCFTFAGHLANKVVAKWFGGGAVAESDLTITSPVPLNWSRIPTDPNELLAPAGEVFTPSTRQTVFQQRLPLDLQREEWLQEWITDASVGVVLRRMQAATSREIPAGIFSWLFTAK